MFSLKSVLRACQLRLPPPLLTLLFAASMWLIAASLPAFSLAIPLRLPLTAGCLLLSALFGLSALVSFKQHQTSVDPIHPQHSKTLVTSGVYRISRNPMYLGLLFLLLGWAIFLANSVNIILMIMFIYCLNYLQIIPEEQILEQKFGQQFMAYRNRVRRWL